VPFCGALLVLATYGLARRLITPGAALAAAWLVATSPAILFMLMVPMSDVPAAAAWAVACWALLDRRLSSSIAAGVAAGLAILIRPNLVPGAAILGAWCLARVVTPGGEGRRHALAATAGFALGVIAGALGVAAVNQSLHGSPFISGYGSLDDAFSTRFVWPNLVRYGTWLVETQTPLVLAGALALLVPARALWPALTERAALLAMAAFTAVVWVSYLLYRGYDAWWFLRFLLPSWPYLMTGSAAVLSLIAARGRLARLLVVTGVVALGLWQVHVAIDRQAFNLWREERRYVTVARHVARLTEPDSAIFSRQHSGSIRYYAGRLTVRFEEFEPGDLDRAVAWFAAQGIRSYLLLDDADMPVARQVLTGQAADRLREPPVLHYSGTAQVYLYELSHARDRGVPTVTVREDWADTRSVPPSPLATSDFAPAR
jgi:4-amino-4-deoxy-L-arabinose transferase-like glycosyltransferase